MAESANGPDESDGTEPSQALMSALTTEHFVLQSAASTTVSEAAGRSSLFMSARSAALIAVGFATSNPHLLSPLLATTLPTLAVLGLFTVVRLVDTGVQNVLTLAQIARIRDYYATLGGDAASFFAPPGNSGETDQALASMGLTAGPLLGLFTTASMIATVNAIIVGTGSGLLLRSAAPSWPLWTQILLGAAVAASLLATFLRYQDGRYKSAAH